MKSLGRYLPVLDWGRHYSRSILTSDLIAAVIVTVMLIPQSLAYAMLAGLPPEVGLYASVLPLVAYAIFGSSRTLAVGPVAVASLMTASAVGQVATQGSVDYATAAATLALLSGGILFCMGILRLGFLANFLSHPVISGFITASGILIAASQIKHMFGLNFNANTLPEIILGLIRTLPQANLWTLGTGVTVLAVLYYARTRLALRLIRMGIAPRMAGLVARTAPIFAIAGSILAAHLFQFGGHGVALVGAIPQGLPLLTIPDAPMALVNALIMPAVLISVIGFVESVSVAQTLAARRRQSISPDQELLGLGAANVAAGLAQGYPVTGGFARSVVNFDAGAQTPAAGIFTAAGIALAALFLTPLLADLPQATLSATIILAVLSLVDFAALRQVWSYSKADFSAMAVTIVLTLSVGVEVGVLSGVVLSLGLYLYRTSRPHIAVVGQVPGTEHFRNVDRHDVQTDRQILSIRVDESLYFANARYLEDHVADLVAAHPDVRHVVLMCSAVNAIDASALESLEQIAHRLGAAGISLHLSEVKGPVMDRLKGTDFLTHLSGRVFLSQFQAVTVLRTLP